MEKVMINDDAFAEMVAEEVKNKLHSSEKKILLQEENWDRWKQCLLALVDNLEEQIYNIENDAAHDKIRYEAMGADGRRLAKEAAQAYNGRKSKIGRFLFHVNKRLDQVNGMMETGKVIESDGWTEAELLKKAIIRHRSMLRDYDLEETAIDRALWSTLDGSWKFDEIDPSSL
jgi:hypothetical protein